MGVTVLGIQHRVVALRKESVDRNVFGFGAKLVHSLSLSARRAWIEILLRGQGRRLGAWSLSARRAWIEILNQGQHTIHPPRSLSARRAWIEI